MARERSSSAYVALTILLFVALGCSKFGSLTGGKSDPQAEQEKRLAQEAIKRDLRADPPTPSAMVIARLAELDPSLARFGAKVEAVEKSVIKKSIADASKTPDEKGSVPRASLALPDGSARFGTGFARPSIATALMMFQASTVDSPTRRAEGAALVAGLVAGLKEILTDAQTSAVAGGVKGNKTETKDGVKSTMGAELMYREDGSSAFGLQFDTEATDKDGSKLTSQLSGRVDGTDCPNAEGQVPITVKLRIGGESGGTGYTQDVEAFIRTTVDDDANEVSTTVDIVQGTREILKGDDIYVETGFTATYRGDTYEESNWRLIRHSQSAAADVGKTESIAAGGQQTARTVTQTIVAMAKQKWQNGGCVKIEAKSPGQVEPSSVTEVPVTVKHKWDGSSVASKVTIQLAGETSVTPKQIDQTPGKLSYTAPPEKNKSATIKLEARSKRGRAQLDLNATTGGNAYRISGTIDEASMSGTTCDSSQPFTIGGTLTFSFTPSSATTGTYTYRGPYSANGHGPYVINDNGTMKLDGTGCIMGGGCATYSHTWTATPIDPGSCK